MTRNNFFVITGGPGSGKSTLLYALQEGGYVTVPETARTIIKERLAKGLSPRPDPISFALQILDKDMEQFNASRSQTKPVFFDRSFLDSALMLRETDETEYEKIEPFIDTNRFNQVVFFAPPWKIIYRNDSERDQSFEEAVQVYEKLFSFYRLKGYVPLVLPMISVEERVSFIVTELRRQEVLMH